MGIKDEAARRRKMSIDQATEKLAQHFGFNLIEEIEIDGETFEIAFQSMWSPEQIKRMQELDEYVSTLDHEDVEERNAETNEILVYPDTHPEKPGEVVFAHVPKSPYQLDGEPIEPAYGFRYLTALWGDEEKARRAEAGGLTYGLVSMLSAKMGDQFTKWQRARAALDSKSR